MENEMILRMARAIGSELEKDDMPEGGWGALMRDAARATLKAMRDPTEAMIRAGENTPLTSLGNGQYADPRPEAVYRAMIDTALNPEKQS